MAEKKEKLLEKLTTALSKLRSKNKATDFTAGGLHFTAIYLDFLDTPTVAIATAGGETYEPAASLPSDTLREIIQRL